MLQENFAIEMCKNLRILCSVAVTACERKWASRHSAFLAPFVLAICVTHRALELGTRIAQCGDTNFKMGVTCA